MDRIAPPADEVRRLAALAGYSIVGTPPEQAFQDLVMIAAALCDAPMAAVTLVDRERQWTKAAIGIDTGECRREDALCNHAILVPDRPLVVRDMREDARFRDNPFVVGAAGVRFYAGAPLVTAEGLAMGALCVLDTRPRTLAPQQLQALEGLARQAVAQMELRRAYAALRHHASERIWYERQLELARHRLAEENAQLVQASLTDELTGLPNRRAAGLHLDRAFVRATTEGAPLVVGIVDIDFFKAINDQHGHPVGDQVLVEVGRRLDAHSGPDVFVARLGGEEFVTIIARPLEEARVLCEAMRAAVAAAEVAHPVTVSIGLTHCASGDAPGDIYSRADLALYRAKHAGRNRVVALEPGPREAAEDGLSR